MAKQIRETSRSKTTRSPYPVVIIVCEGEKTEPVYFNHFKKMNRNKPLHIEIVKDASGKSYTALIKKAAEAKKDYVDKTDVTEWDVWCVSDVDVDYNTPDSQSARNIQLKKYANDAKSNNFKIALSNPCFELWFLLHFECSTGNIRDYPAVKKILSKYLPDYQKNNDVYGQLSDKMETAMLNAKKLKDYHKEHGKTDYMDVSVNPYTNVWELVESLCN